MTSINACWSLCKNDTRCYAIAYKSNCNDNCLLLDYYFTYIQESGWTVYSLIQLTGFQHNATTRISPSTTKLSTTVTRQSARG